MRGEIVIDDETGQETFAWLPEPEPPPGGYFIDERGRQLRRKGPDVYDSAPSGRLVDYGHVAHSLPPWDPCAPRHTPDGKPVFQSKREVQEYVARTNGRMVWDP